MAGARKADDLHLSIFRSGEWATVVFELNDRGRGFAGHVVDGVLITEPI